ncbi:haloacid dehalogenase-like hydrolase (HAD) superfamily protein [Artemisia annua]|uniref:Mitochondrial import inner membrane translocase subunit TIM50 n=1 Tax=Artemisia annua TaxID=35608 RepID=A0A2U1KHA0_ARTAN|nr:haloacid dehalogenase-like hydrolase (HAD) superfamily protein [Artemisia annua]
MDPKIPEQNHSPAKPAPRCHIRNTHFPKPLQLVTRSLVLEKLDKKGVISHKLYRASCKECDGRFVKDLSGLGRDLKKAVIVDDNPNSYSLQPENAIPIRPFVDDFGDVELKKLMDGFFKRCDEFDDLKDAVKSYISESVKSIDEGVFGDSKDSNYQALIEV